MLASQGRAIAVFAICSAFGQLSDVVMGADLCQRISQYPSPDSLRAKPLDERITVFASDDRSELHSQCLDVGACVWS